MKNLSSRSTVSYPESQTQERKKMDDGIKLVRVFTNWLREGLTLGKFISVILVILLIAILVPIGDQQWWHLDRLSKQTEILERLHNLEKSGITQDPNLREVYSRLLEELKSYRFGEVWLISLLVPVWNWETFWKFVSAAFPFLLAGLSLAFTDMNKKNAFNTFLAILLLVLIFGWLGTLIPTSPNSPWLNYLGVPAGFLAIALIVSQIIKRVRGPAT